MAQPNQRTESTVNGMAMDTQEVKKYDESIMNLQAVSVASTPEEPSPLINRKRNLSEPKKAKSDRQCNDSKEAVGMLVDIEEDEKELEDREGDSGAQKGPVAGRIIASARWSLYGKTPTQERKIGFQGQSRQYFSYHAESTECIIRTESSPYNTRRTYQVRGQKGERVSVQKDKQIGNRL